MHNIHGTSFWSSLAAFGNDNDRFTSYMILALSLEGSVRRSYMIPTIGLAPIMALEQAYWLTLACGSAWLLAMPS